MDDDLLRIFDLGKRLAITAEADALIVLVEDQQDWHAIKKYGGRERVIAAADDKSHLEGAVEAGLETVFIDEVDSPIHEQLTQTLLECVNCEKLEAGASVVAVYSGFEPGMMDSVSLIKLREHLKRLTSRDLRKLHTKVPLDVLKRVVDLATEIGHEGREGKAVGTLFIVGDTKKVLSHSKPAGFDPVKGYNRQERDIADRRVREAIKEIAQMDGAFIISPSGVVEASARYIDASADGLSLPKGLGSRHWAAAAISHVTKAVAVVVSQSTGTVRIFQDGHVALRIEPLDRPMRWKEFEFEPPSSD
ncbi:MAG: DNA integrity scanning protein DisA nucleotide-binding domain protein [Pirellulales bacterium]|nr:DNA integrity scanning protein DisA nucleotide-binding domain protein [Pirellulales bacterium]